MATNQPLDDSHSWDPRQHLEEEEYPGTPEEIFPFRSVSAPDEDSQHNWEPEVNQESKEVAADEGEIHRLPRFPCPQATMCRYR